MTKRILIAGLGLIGGSIALNLKEYTDHYLIGYDINQKTLSYAIDKQIVDQVSTDFEAIVTTVDVCILAAPVSKTIKLIEQIKQLKFEKTILITDVSSVKTNVMKIAESIDQAQVTFIGGHPMAGSHKQGIEAAKSHLFENAIYILTPTKTAAEEAISELKSLLSTTKATFITLDAEEHDEMTSVISHFPHLIASSLVQQAKTWQQKHDKIPRLAAGGFRDITRIASSDPSMWQDIFFQNKNVLARLLDDWINEMKNLKNLLDTNDKVSIYHYLEEAREYRDGLDKTKRGAIPSFYDLFVDIFDQPGAILKVIGLLAEQEISIKNIEILEIREGITGVLRISFVSKEDQLASHRLLIQNGYETMIED
ncbi:prephenate dehydrogenase [Amphibacillus xylanus]|uniref:Prephenate dehydrogenase n=1 Tax=Amphibacillus xylanus (strain ATCC 51415 / DSM 6626 / JCM 7361 / LMG 17667 / NBRC 15112 / Ep01) TaxID=698758 RepID=K0IY68_AMPXN|nr:prephenate dehydrogenase [Amphibacillus xylanus]BAM47379.1 prephenate dehydrogenase [Amphibacillus xylanus NBRC 15112]